MQNYNDFSITDATALQNQMRHKVSLQTVNKEITTIAGADISHNKNTDIVFAGIVILSYPQMALQSYSLVETSTKFPYVPGYLGFREVPALMEAWEQIPVKPDIVILDGQGITHPRSMGIACHFGVLSNHPSIGCAKNMLFGNYPPLPLEKMATSPIINNGEIMGFALRTKAAVKPVYISPGHRISVADSIAVIKNCVGKYRIPEPTRLAHDTVNLFRTGKLKSGYHQVSIQPDLFSS